MKSQNKINPQAVKHAAEILNAQIQELQKKIVTTAPGAARDALELELKGLMESIGMEYVPNPKMKDAPAIELGEGEELKLDPETGIGAAMLSATLEAERKIGAAHSDTDKGAEEKPLPKLSLWQRIKLSYQLNKKKYWGGLAVVLAAAAGTYYWLKNNNSATVSSVSGMADGAPAPEVVTEGGAEAASIFTRIGAWFVSAGVYIKDTAVSAWTWVKNLFNKSTTETGNGQTDVGVEAVPA